jgi:hypothetical protein
VRSRKQILFILTPDFCLSDPSRKRVPVETAEEVLCPFGNAA